jgi:hypothetical protein
MVNSQVILNPSQINSKPIAIFQALKSALLNLHRKKLLEARRDSSIHELFKITCDWFNHIKVESYSQKPLCSIGRIFHLSRLPVAFAAKFNSSTQPPPIFRVQLQSDNSVSATLGFLKVVPSAARSYFVSTTFRFAPLDTSHHSP